MQTKTATHSFPTSLEVRLPFVGQTGGVIVGFDAPGYSAPRWLAFDAVGAPIYVDDRGAAAVMSRRFAELCFVEGCAGHWIALPGDCVGGCFDPDLRFEEAA